MCVSVVYLGVGGDATVVGSGDLSRLTWTQCIKVGARSPYTMEEVALAVGEMIVVLFVKKVRRCCF